MSDGPYARAAHAYRAAGWNPLPLPAGRKWPPPDGYTGATGVDPSGADIQAWVDGREGAGNIALRLPPGVIGIDVDNYQDKPGDVTLTGLTERLGQLPPTWRTTSRDDGVSGIYLYRVPPGLRWPGVLGPGIEVIQDRHRYAVVWPSVHPDTGSTYDWTDDAGIEHVGPWAIPDPGELPELPAAWVDGITGGALAVDHERAEISDVGAVSWLVQRIDGTDNPCHAVGTVLEAHREALRLRQSARHDLAVAFTQAAVHLVAEGHRAGRAIEVYRQLWWSALQGEGRRGDDLVGEWDRMLTGAVAIAVAAHPDTPDIDPCLDPFRGLVAPSSSPAPTVVASDRGPSSPVATIAPVAASSRAGGPSNLFEMNGQTWPPPAPPAPPVAHVNGSAGPATVEPSADDLTELELNRNRLAYQQTEIERARRTARRLLDDEEAAKTFRPPTYTADLAAELEIPDEEIRYRVHDVLPVGANVVMTAAFKAGKTTMIDHLAGALADGILFLGRHHVEPGGRIAIFNYEVERNMHRRWMRQIGLVNPKRITVLPLRGFRVPLTSAPVEKWVIEWLKKHEITTWIVDPFARAFTGISENDNTEVGRFLDTLDVIKERAGVSELIMPVHTGRADQVEGAERARGATRIDDWADVRWLLTKDDKGDRYFRATGRDVDVDEIKIGYDEDSRRPFVIGGSRALAREASFDSEVLQVITDDPGISYHQLRISVRQLAGKASTDKIDAARDRLEARGQIRVERTTEGRPRTSHYPCDAIADLIGKPVEP